MRVVRVVYWLDKLTSFSAVFLLLAIAPAVGRAQPAPGTPPGGQPPVYIVLGAREGGAHPYQCGHASTGGGTISVVQPAPDTVVVTFLGTATAASTPFHESFAALDFVLDQGFGIRFADPKLRTAKLALGVRVHGLLRNQNPRGGSAQMTKAFASLRCDANEILNIGIEPKSLGSLPRQDHHCRHAQAIASTRGPVCIPVVPGNYCLHQSFGISANQCRGCLGWGVSAEFAPPPCLAAKWIGHNDPFHGIDKSNFGFQVILRVVPGEMEDNANAAKEVGRMK